MLRADRTPSQSRPVPWRRGRFRVSSQRSSNRRSCGRRLSCPIARRQRARHARLAYLPRQSSVSVCVSLVVVVVVLAVRSSLTYRRITVTCTTAAFTSFLHRLYILITSSTITGEWTTDIISIIYSHYIIYLIEYFFFCKVF